MSIQKATPPPSGAGSYDYYYDHGGDSSPSSPLRRHNNNDDKLEDSDEDLFTVPDVEAAGPPQLLPSQPSIDSTNQSNTAKRRRGSNPADREHKRLKRLLRNRVSAQQARERRKVYVNDLESRAKELQDLNMTLEGKISTLINENSMLRKVLMNTRPKIDDDSV